MVLTQSTPFGRLRTGIQDAEEILNLGKTMVSIKAIKALTQGDAERPLEGPIAELHSNA